MECFSLVDKAGLGVGLHGSLRCLGLPGAGSLPQTRPPSGTFAYFFNQLGWLKRDQSMDHPGSSNCASAFSSIKPKFGRFWQTLLDDPSLFLSENRSCLPTTEHRYVPSAWPTESHRGEHGGRFSRCARADVKTTTTGEPWLNQWRRGVEEMGHGFHA